MNRRTLVSGLGTVALLETLAWGKDALLPPGIWNALAFEALTNNDTLRPFQIKLPQHIEALPFGSSDSHSRPSFKIRGTKGYAWSPEQYLAEIPVMAKYRLNFLMNCYSSFWELGPHGSWVTDRPMNFWYRPLPSEKREMYEKVIRSCQQHGITFCLSINPNLRSDRAFDYASPEDLNALWQHYAWGQSVGVKWFNISLDDISRNISAEGHASLVNNILQRLRSHDPEAQLTFCPTWYAGTGESGIETHARLGARVESPNHSKGAETPGTLYLKTLAQQLHPDVYLFWTGPEVESPTINAEQALRYKTLSGHRILLWDNYPVNDQLPALDLGPLRGRSADLCSVVDGYISNPMGYENEANRIPLLTIADYLWNPKEYDPARSIGQSIAHLGDTPAKRQVLCSFVELYPGRLWDNTSRPQWNSLRVRFDQLLLRREHRQARELVTKAQTTLVQMKALFPDAWSSGSRVLELDVTAMLIQLDQK